MKDCWNLQGLGPVCVQNCLVETLNERIFEDLLTQFRKTESEEDDDALVVFHVAMRRPLDVVGNQVKIRVPILLALYVGQVSSQLQAACSRILKRPMELTILVDHKEKPDEAKHPEPKVELYQGELDEDLQIDWPEGNG